MHGHVKREALRFLKALEKRKDPRLTPEIGQLRPHSGRAMLITELMGEGLSTALSMKCARRAPGSVRVHLRYGRLTLQDVQAACDRVEPRSETGKKRKWFRVSWWFRV